MTQREIHYIMTMTIHKNSIAELSRPRNQPIDTQHDVMLLHQSRHLLHNQHHHVLSVSYREPAAQQILPANLHQLVTKNMHGYIFLCGLGFLSKLNYRLSKWLLAKETIISYIQPFNVISKVIDSS